jgi:phosphoribosyl 1,2-cyclic phosphate phosphodiesterase
VDAVFYTHTHADHILGIDDLRPLSYRHKPAKLPLYARPDAAAFLRKMFSYIFDADYKYGGLPQLELRPIDGPVELFGAHFEPVWLLHGDAEIYGFRFGTAAYLTDHSEIPVTSFRQLEGLDILFLDALRHKPHPTHSTVENSLRIVERVKAKRAFFTHICHDLAHEATNATLPPHVRLAYDGMKLDFEI